MSGIAIDAQELKANKRTKIFKSQDKSKNNAKKLLEYIFIKHYAVSYGANQCGYIWPSVVLTLSLFICNIWDGM